MLTLCYFTPSRAGEAFVIGVAEENANVLNFENEHFSGSMANAVNCVLARIDQGFTVVSAPHARILKLLELKEVDAVVPMIKTPDRDVYADYVGNLFDVEFTIVFPKPFNNIASEDFITQKNMLGISLKRGTYVTRLAAQLLNQPISEVKSNLYEVRSWQDSLRMVVKERAFLTIVPSNTLDLLHTSQIEKLNTSNVMLLSASFYVGKHKVPLKEQFLKTIPTCSQLN